MIDLGIRARNFQRAPENSPGDRTNPSRTSASRDSSKSASQNNEPMEYVASKGHGSQCGCCTGQMVAKSQAKAMKAARNKKNMDHVKWHEAAHRSRGGRFAGSESIVQDPETGETHGEVLINIVKLDERNPQEAVECANCVIASATAPGGDMSAQDGKVAAMGSALLSKASSALSRFQSQSRNPQQPDSQGNSPFNNPFAQT